MVATDRITAGAQIYRIRQVASMCTLCNSKYMVSWDLTSLLQNDIQSIESNKALMWAEWLTDHNLKHVS